jgi:hypothetical protein
MSPPVLSSAVSKFEKPEVDLSRSESAPNLKFERADWTSFRTVEGLQQKAGVAQDKLIRLVLKELTDNALDTETRVRVGALNAGGYFIEDQGSGLDPANIAQLFSVNRPLVSTKLLRLPTRGALGNGLRVAAGAVLASDGFLSVETRGVRLRLKPGRDGCTQVIERSASGRKTGTRIEIGFGPDLPGDADALHWAHLAIRLARGGAYAGKSSPWWYDLPQFHELLSASGGVPVRALIESLDGCAGGRAGEIVALAGLSRMKCHDLNQAQAARLLETARDSAKPVSPKRLGAVGPDTFPGRAYAITYGSAPFGSRLRADIPFVIEVWAEQAREKNFVAASVNRTPVAGEMSLQRDKNEVNLFGCGLRHTVAKAPKELRFNVWLNITTPYMPITSDGKEPDLTPFLAVIAEAMTKAIRKVRRPGAGVVSQKDIVLDHLAEVSEAVSGPERYRFNSRQLFYRMRPIVLEETSKELQISNFLGILDDYERENGEIALMYREPRGSLTHPHRNETITLGTLMVEDYERPVWCFNKLLYIEKEGAQEALKQNRWLERHDCAVMSSKGFSTRAARDLIDKLVAHDEPVTVFCAHDADASGTMIYQTLQEATRARIARKILIVNIGLEPWEAVEMGLEAETIEAKDRRKPVANYVLLQDDDWMEWLQTHRVELNAMTTPQLIEWLDEKMERFGPGKLIPPAKVLEQDLKARVKGKVRAEITERILREVRLDSQVDAAMAALDLPDGEELTSGIQQMFEGQPDAEWRAHIEVIAEASGDFTAGAPRPRPARRGRKRG